MLQESQRLVCSHLITRRCRELNVYCEMLPCTQKIKELDWTPKGIILSGSPYSVYDEGAPRVDPDVFDAGVPVLGICYGLQEIAWNHGGKVDPHDKREYGSAKVEIIKTGDKHMDALFEDVSGEVEVSVYLKFGPEHRLYWLCRSGCRTATNCRRRLKTSK